MSSIDDEELRRRKFEEALEVKSLRRIISAYLNYPEAAEEDIRRYERCFRRLPLAHKAFEPPVDMSVDVDTSEDQTIENASDNSEMTLPCQSGSKRGKLHFAKADEFSSGEGGNGALESFQPETVSKEKKIDHSNENAGNCSQGSKCNGKVSSSSPDWLDPSLQFRVPLVDADKVRCIIRNILRDWAAEGQRERDECYKPILNELERLFPHRSRDSPACLVPGAGLGRLALEISCLGFMSQGNEFSYYMMICSSFILNHCQVAEEWTIYPWIHSNCNSLSDNDQLRPVSFPDIHPASVEITDGFSMCGGDFVEVYSDPSQVGVWEAVVTCFFLDTAHNIVEYIEIISRILKDGGVWINLGPLLYHFADMYNQEDEMSVELSLEDVKRVACHYGFEMEMESTIATTYTTNVRSMMQTNYA